jgi:hypothetical protein
LNGVGVLAKLIHPTIAWSNGLYELASVGCISDSVMHQIKHPPLIEWGWCISKAYTPYDRLIKRIVRVSIEMMKIVDKLNDKRLINQAIVT